MGKDKNLDIYLDGNYLASFWRRLLASLIDGLILLIVSLIIFYFKGGISLKNISLGYALFIISFSFLYELLQTYFFGMTIGKRILKIKVVSGLGCRIKLNQSIYRSIIKYLSARILFIGYLWMIRSELNQTWHDVLSNTLVIENDTEDEILACLGNNPIKISRRNRFFRTLALIFTLIIFSYSSLDIFANEIGDFGIEEITSFEVGESFLHTKLLDIDGDRTKEIITLSEKDYRLVMNIYDWEENDIKLIESFILEESEINIRKWHIADLDDDGIAEVVLSHKEKSGMKLKIYKKDNLNYNAIESIDYGYGSFEVLEDVCGKKQLILYGKGSFDTYSLVDMKLVKNISQEIGRMDGRFIKADFDGDSYDELYCINDKYDGKKYKAFITRMDFDNGLINQTPVGSIYLKPILRLGYLKNRAPANFMIEDINGDGKDDIVFQTEYRYSDSWLNTFTLDDGKWIKIYSGGYMQSGRFDMQFLGKGDINGDGIEELVVSGDIIGALMDEKGGFPVENTFYFYQIDSIEFKLNRVYQWMHDIVSIFIPLIKS